ncbi:prohead protease inhibitor [Vibrio phage F86]
MIETHLKELTKRGVIEFAEANYIDVDKHTTKGKIIAQILEHEDDIDVSLIALDDADVEEITEDGESVAEVIEVADVAAESVVPAFKPKWSPSYRRGDELYQLITHDTIHDYNIGRRDTHELQTMAFWVERNGKLLVRDSLTSGFIYLG